MSERFYINCPLQAGPMILEGGEAHHLAVVCRLGPGDPVCLFNGDGREYPARILEIRGRRAILEVQAAVSPSRELGFPLEVAAPLPRGDRTQFLIEKLTEIGVTAFVPLITRHSVIPVSAARREKLTRHVIEASKQCGRNVLLQIGPEMEWGAYCRFPVRKGTRLVAHPGPEGPIGRDFPELSPPPEGFHLAVGPEGGFTEEEIADAVSAGWRVVDLGPRVLRVETSALVLASWIIFGHRPDPTRTEPGAGDGS